MTVSRRLILARGRLATATVAALGITAALLFASLSGPPAGITGSPEVMQPSNPTPPLATGQPSAQATKPLNAGIADCPAGSICFYDRANFGYPRGQLSSCGWHDLKTFAWNDRIESAYYNLSAGAAQFFDTDGAAMFSVNAGSRALSSVGLSSANRAVKMYRYC